MKYYASLLLLATTIHPWADFDASMGKNHPRYHHYYAKMASHSESQQLLTHLRTICEHAIDRLESPGTDYQIPKKIHQIWLGSPLPDKFKAYAATWQQHHPDWQYHVWTDADIVQLGLENQAIYDQAINYAQRSDIARYEILYRFGGLYVDTDCECTQPFDVLHKAYTFYAGIELPAMAPWLGMIMLPNTVIGTVPGHPIMRACIDEVKQRAGMNTQDIVIKTGPLLFTDVVLAWFKDRVAPDAILLPASYFYPIDKETKHPEAIKAMIKPETFSIHHWAGSWILKQEAFVPGIKITSTVKDGVIKFMIRDERIKP